MNYDEMRQLEAERTERLISFGKKIAMGVVGGFFLTMTACGSFYSVEQGERGIHTRTGALVGVSQPGFHFKFPFIDGVSHISIRATPIEWKLQPDADSRMASYSKDQQPAHIALTVTWSLPGDEKTMGDIFTTYGSREGFYRAVVLPKSVEAVKGVFGSYDAVSVIQQRAKFNVEVAEALAKLLEGYPVNLGGVQVQDIEFSDAYEDAVEARMTAQVEVQKREQQKQTAQIDADIAVIKAEAAAQQTRLNGEAEAAAIKARADALASNAKLVDLTAVEKWNGVLPSTMVPGSAMPFINVK
jgi:regulator of protease activity HflC (stomatin/prohibitin superfamily)